MKNLTKVDVWVFLQVLRDRENRRVIGVFAVRDDATIVSAQVGKTNEIALEGFRERLQKRLLAIARAEAEEGIFNEYQIHYTENPRAIRALSLILKALEGEAWDRIRDGMILAFDYTHEDAFFGTAGELQDLRRACPECGLPAPFFGKVASEGDRETWSGDWGCASCGFRAPDDEYKEMLEELLAEKRERES